MEKQSLIELIERVVRWEIEAQAGVDRPTEDWPQFIADTLLDYFVIEPLDRTAAAFPPGGARSR